MSKIATALIDDNVDDEYHNYIPCTQFGAARGKGADMANHWVRSMIDYARMCSLSICVLFLDLSKAFDNTIREYVFGDP